MAYAPDLAALDEKLCNSINNVTEMLIGKLDELDVNLDNFDIHPSRNVQEGQGDKAFKKLTVFADQVTGRYGVLAPEGIAVMHSLMEVHPIWLAFKNAYSHKADSCEQA